MDHEGIGDRLGAAQRPYRGVTEYHGTCRIRYRDILRAVNCTTVPVRMRKCQSIISKYDGGCNVQSKCSVYSPILRAVTGRQAG